MYIPINIIFIIHSLRSSVCKEYAWLQPSLEKKKKERKKPNVKKNPDKRKKKYIIFLLNNLLH